MGLHRARLTPYPSGMTRRLLALVTSGVGLVALGSTTAYADASMPGGVGDPAGLDPGGFDSGPPAWFGVFFVLILLAGIATAVWRVSLARTMAKDSGLDPDQAAAMSLMSDEGLSATYLASNLRGRRESSDEPGPARTAAERLRELEQLRAQGLVTDDEYATRRRAIIDSV